MRSAPRTPASTVAPVPWMSSLKQRYSFRYLERRVDALSDEKSSNCSNADGYFLKSAWMNSSKSE